MRTPTFPGADAFSDSHDPSLPCVPASQQQYCNIRPLARANFSAAATKARYLLIYLLVPVPVGIEGGRKYAGTVSGYPYKA